MLVSPNFSLSSLSQARTLYAEVTKANDFPERGHPGSQETLFQCFGKVGSSLLFHVPDHEGIQTRRNGSNGSRQSCEGTQSREAMAPMARQAVDRQRSRGSRLDVKRAPGSRRRPCSNVYVQSAPGSYSVDQERAHRPTRTGSNVISNIRLSPSTQRQAWAPAASMEWTGTCQTYDQRLALVGTPNVITYSGPARGIKFEIFSI